MKTKTETLEYKDRPVLAVKGIGQKGKEYNIMSAGAAKWARVLDHLEEIQAFVADNLPSPNIADNLPTPIPALADKSTTKKD